MHSNCSAGFKWNNKGKNFDLITKLIVKLHIMVFGISNTYSCNK